MDIYININVYHLLNGGRRKPQTTKKQVSLSYAWGRRGGQHTKPSNVNHLFLIRKPCIFSAGINFVIGVPLFSCYFLFTTSFCNKTH